MMQETLWLCPECGRTVRLGVTEYPAYCWHNGQAYELTCVWASPLDPSVAAQLEISEEDKNDEAKD